MEIAEEYKPVSKKLLTVDELPQGALSRYLRGIYTGYRMGGGTKPYDEWLVEEEIFSKRMSEIRERLHPLRFRKSYRFDRSGPEYGGYDYGGCHKRDGEGWYCHIGNDGPYGGEGWISIEKLLTLLSPEDRAEIEAIGDLRDTVGSNDGAEVCAEYERLYGPCRID